VLGGKMLYPKSKESKVRYAATVDDNHLVLQPMVLHLGHGLSHKKILAFGLGRWWENPVVQLTAAPL